MSLREKVEALPFIYAHEGERGCRYLKMGDVLALLALPTEHRLRDYAQHKPDCYIYGPRRGIGTAHGTCTCGLAALLASAAQTPETPMSTESRPFWMEVADIRTDDPLESKLRATTQRVETEGGCSELMTSIVISLSEARIELKRRRLTNAHRDSTEIDGPNIYTSTTVRDLPGEARARPEPPPQVDLPASAAKVLRENLWKLYDGAQPEPWQPIEHRLVAFALAHARKRHEDYFVCRNLHEKAGDPPHVVPFEMCPHADCAMVREARRKPAPSAEADASSRLPCAYCQHTDPHTGSSAGGGPDDPYDACSHPGCNCGYYSPREEPT